MFLRQNTAVTIPFGPFLDETDGKTPETGLTIAQADIRLSKNGATFAQSGNVAGAAHMEGGDYGVPLNATDANTPGHLRVRIHVAGVLPVWKDFLVVPAPVYDGLILGTLAPPGQGAPAASMDAFTMLAYLFKAWFHKSEQDDAEWRLFNAAGTVVDQKAPVTPSVDTVTRGKVQSGP